MSYSRWSGSRWYTYWLASNKTKMEEQLLCIQCVAFFSFTELRSNSNACLEKAISIENRLSKDPVNQEESVELLNIFSRFLNDVEKRHRDNKIAKFLDNKPTTVKEVVNEETINPKPSTSNIL